MSTESGTGDYGRFDELAEEFADRYRRGERPDLQEYIDRLPEMAEEVRESERFRREARAAAKLHHTNIVPVFEVGQDGDVRFYAMQFIDGLGLDAVIAELSRLLDRARSQPGIKAASGGRSPRPRGGPSRHGTDRPTLGDGVEVSLVLRSILTGRFDPGRRGPDPARASPSMPAGTLAGGLATSMPAAAAPGPCPTTSTRRPPIFGKRWSSARRIKSSTSRAIASSIAPRPSAGRRPSGISTA
jgi:hypothetical protein